MLVGKPEIQSGFLSKWKCVSSWIAQIQHLVTWMHAYKGENAHGIHICIRLGWSRYAAEPGQNKKLSLVRNMKKIGSYSAKTDAALGSNNQLVGETD